MTSGRSSERTKLLADWFKSLPRDEQDTILAIAEVLIAEMQTRPATKGAKRFGMGMALEVIWAVGRYLNEPLARRLGEEHGTSTG